MKKNKKIILLVLIIFAFIVFIPNFVQAERYERDIGAGRESSCNCQMVNGEKICTCMCQSANEVPNCKIGWLISDPICACCGDCTLENFLELGINLANQILKYLGIVALAAFILGGLVWLTSAGSKEKVEKGKKIIVGALIGLVIVLFSFVIVRFVMKGMGTGEYLPEQIKSTSGESEEISDWPDCPSLSEVTAIRPWCYGCTWTGIDRGCQSGEVKQYQIALNNEGYNCGTPDSKFGPQTEECTKRFQRANDLSADGMVGPGTRDKFIEVLEQGISWIECPSLEDVSDAIPWCYSCSWTGIGKGMSK